MGAPGNHCKRAALIPLLALLVGLAPCGAAAPPKHRQLAIALSDPYGGMVTGQLVTVTGNQFFQYFVTFWRDKPLSDRYALTVRERPSVLRGSTIAIDCLNRTVFQATLPNARGDMKAFSLRAVDIAFQNASQAEVQRLLFREPDLGADEF